MTLYADIDLLDFFLYTLILPFLGVLAVSWLLTRLGNVVRPRVAAWWDASSLRVRDRALSKAQLLFGIAVACNGVALFVSLPLWRVPPGSGIKPMGLILFSLIANAIALAAWHTIGGNAERTDGSGWLALIAVLLCWTPFVVAVALMHWIAWMHDLQFG